METRPAVKKVFFDSTTAELSTAEQTSTDRSSESDLSQSMGSDESTSSDENMTLCLHRVKRSFSKKNAINTVNAVNLKIPTSVNVSIRGYELAALLDGGSATTLMRASFARSVKLKWSTVNTGKKWVGAEGGKLNVVGVVKRGGDHRLLDRDSSQSKQAIVVYKVNKKKQKAKTNKPKVNKFAPG